MTFVKCWTNVFDVGPTLYKCHTNVLCLLGRCSLLVYGMLAGRDGYSIRVQLCRSNTRSKKITDGFSYNVRSNFADVDRRRRRGVNLYGPLTL